MAAERLPVETSQNGWAASRAEIKMETHDVLLVQMVARSHPQIRIDIRLVYKTTDMTIFSPSTTYSVRAAKSVLILWPCLRLARFLSRRETRRSGMKALLVRIRVRGAVYILYSYEYRDKS